MSVILKKYKGESATFGFVLPDSYDLANMQDVKIYVGSKVYPHVIDNERTVKAKLTSEDTDLLSGRNSVIFHIDDSVFGIRKILVGEFQVDASKDDFKDESVNLGYDVLVMLKVDVDTIEVDSILYNVAKGDSAFTAWQKLPENVGKDWNDYIAYLREPMTQAIEDGEQTAAEWAIVENARREAEEIRIASEGLRVLAEGVRNDSEILRVSSENIRYSNENTRNDNELQRNSNENIRISNALAANNAEALRLSAELLRISAESNRTSAETARVNSEALRVTAENNRVSAEALRVTAENNRVSAENIRVSAENIRISNEAARVASGAEMLTNKKTIINPLSTSEYPNSKGVADYVSKTKKDIEESIFKTLTTSASGLITFSPTTRYFTYKLNILDNVTINVDLQRMISQIGNARCRLIIDIPILKTITFTKSFLWGGTAPTFSSAGQYILEVIDVDGSGTPLMWQVAYTAKAQATGNILYVDSSTADYTVGQINAGTPTRLTSSWASPFKYLQNAINAATAGDVIFVKAGTLYPTHLKTTPTVYVDGNHLSRDATFSMKTGVDVYGGFLGTETKSWQRKVDAKGYPLNKTILSGDVKREAVIDAAIVVGDRRTTLSKANAAKGVVYATASSYTYFNGFEVIFGNTDGNGGGISSTNNNFVGINNVVRDNTAANYGGGWSDNSNINCISHSNTALLGGAGWINGTNIGCTSYCNSSATGGGWRGGTNINCIAYSNAVTLNGGGWYDGVNTNIIAFSNSSINGGGGYVGTNKNCTLINNRGSQGLYNSTSTDPSINCLLFNNKNSSNAIVGFNDIAASGIKLFRNNAYDTSHPTITGGAGSDINFTTCLQNVTQGQIKIEVPSFVGAATNETQLNELKAYAANILTNLRPKSGSILKGAGINNATYPNPTDFEGNARSEASTIGILEGE